MARFDNAVLQRAAQAVASAEALLIGAGAGMGVDSGLPDFRGNKGFWRAYPPYEKRGLKFKALANPHWFVREPTLAWGFYGHRLNLYRSTRPHAGFQILRTWASRMRHGVFVFTSNVDGQFQRAGFDNDRIVEVHGSIDWMQCTQSIGHGLFSVESFQIDVDESTMRARGPLPTCPTCGSLVRPNILMFDDTDWDRSRRTAQLARFYRWMQELSGARLVIIECGAGTAIPSVRHQCEQVARDDDAILIRINPREPSVPTGHISLPLGAQGTLQAINERLEPS
jgi:NAD-dependent SIR2 family protein deacetylase